MSIMLNENLTNNELYNLVLLQLQRVLVQAGDKMDSDDEEENSDKAKSANQCTLRLSLITHTATLEGDAIPRDDKVFVLGGRDTIAVDWSSKKFYSYKRENDLELDPSVTEGGEEKHSISLYDCLDLFASKEKLGKNDEWFCPKCRVFQQATKKFDLWKLPDVLVVHLKRFQYTTYWRDKIDTYIDFPIEGLDLTKYVLNPNEPPPIYDLFAESIHSGGLSGGHYTAYAKNHKTGRWYSFNDSWASETDAASLKSRGAYVLFYKRRKPAPKKPLPKTPDQSNL